MRYLYTFFLVVTVLLFVFGGSGIRQVAALDLSNLHIAEVINKERLSYGLAPLALNQRLTKAAYDKAYNMFSKQYWAHFGPSGETPWQFILKAGYDYTYAGENLAKGFADARDVVDAWMASPSHRENILDRNFKDVGIAVVKGNLKGEEVYLVVALFGNDSSVSFATPRIPVVAIINPHEGQILKSAVVSVRVKGKNLKNNRINLFSDEKFVESFKLKDNYLETKLYPGLGTHKLTVRARGLRNEPLYDSVTYRVINQEIDVNRIASVVDVYYKGDFVEVKLPSDFYRRFNIGSVQIEYGGGVQVVTSDHARFIKKRGVERVSFVVTSKDGTLISFVKQISHPSSNRAHSTGGLSVKGLSSSPLVFLGSALGFIISSIGGLLYVLVKKDYHALIELFSSLVVFLVLMLEVNGGWIAV